VAWKISFFQTDGILISEQTVFDGDYLNKPNNPVIDGYEFIGWYSDNNCQQLFNFDQVIEENLSVYAKFIKTWTVSFLNNDGTIFATQTIWNGECATMSEITPKEGFEFIGWYADEECLQLYNFGNIINEDIQLFPKFIRVWTVSFAQADGTLISTQTVRNGECINEPVEPVRENLNFKGWYIDSECTQLYDFTTTVSENICLYAKFLGQWTVRFVQDDGTLILEQWIRDSEYATEIEVQSKNNLYFDAWYLDYEYTQYFDLVNTAVTSNITLIARYSTSKNDFQFSEIGEECAIVSYSGNQTSVVIPSSYSGKRITNIYGAFENCTSLTSITIPAGITNIGNSAFYGCTGLTSIAIPNSVTSIDNGAFYGCSNLTYVSIPDSVISIGYVAFSGCTNLVYNIKDNVKYLGNNINPYIVVMELESIECTNLYLQKTTKIIYNYAFESCTNLINLIIPENVTCIGYDAFAGCAHLTSMNIPASVIYLSNGIFKTCANLTTINVDDNNQNYKSIDGNLYTKDGSTLIQYAIGKNESSFTIPAGVTSIGDYAFYGCTSLTDITIQDSITSIGSFAFYGCKGLASVTIPNSIKFIGGWTFFGCTSLINVIIPDSVTTIGWDAFSGCTGLTKINVDIGNTKYKSVDGNLYSKDGKILIQYAIGKTATNFTIPDSVTRIAERAFYGCTSLKNVVIPACVTCIDEWAFWNCIKLTIYCEAESQPSNWNLNWNPSNCPVVWGYTG